MTFGVQLTLRAPCFVNLGPHWVSETASKFTIFAANRASASKPPHVAIHFSARYPPVAPARTAFRSIADEIRRPSRLLRMPNRTFRSRFSRPSPDIRPSDRGNKVGCNRGKQWSDKSVLLTFLTFLTYELVDGFDGPAALVSVSEMGPTGPVDSHRRPRWDRLRRHVVQPQSQTDRFLSNLFRCFPLEGNAKDAVGPTFFARFGSMPS